ncbi:MAG: LptE family protein [Bacteroidales bacterium]|nr:LptE family protein [Bacteroidales bacterium]
MAKHILLALSLCFLLSGCGIYSFSGTSIQADIETITIVPVVNNAMKINPSLANDLTEALKDQFRKMTKLSEAEMDGDLVLEVIIQSYDITPQAITANEVASQNRLTVTARVNFTNSKHSQDSFENKSFVAYSDYNSELSLDAVEATLCEEIIKTLVEDIFNASVAQW